MTAQRRYLVVLFISAVALVGVGWVFGAMTWLRDPELARRAGPLTVVATGDAVVAEPLTPSQLFAASGISTLLGGADVALTNLESTLLDREAEIQNLAAAKGLVGTPAVAETLLAFGVNVVSLANNHAADYGREGLNATRRVVESVGIGHVGAGESLEAARQSLSVGDRPRRVAIIAVTASSAPEARATANRGEIKGRAGVNPLRYSARIVVDPQTFETLTATAKELNAGSGEQTDETLTFFGATITKGERTEVDFVVDGQDLVQIVKEVAARRATSDAVVVSVHSHEPTNASELPAMFLQRFARAVIDAGAALVVGHGPHQIRGVEKYGRGVILYSLGNFVFQHNAIGPQGTDMFDAGVDLFRVAIGAWSRGDGQLADFDDPIWREGLIAEATFAEGAVASLHLHPIELGAANERGAPHLAVGSDAARILKRVRRLSKPFGTAVRIDDGIGRVPLDRRVASAQHPGERANASHR